MKNFTQYAEAGEKTINENDRYDMQLSNYKELSAKLEAGELCLMEVVRQAFCAGVEAGTRIAKKNASN